MNQDVTFAVRLALHLPDSTLVVFPIATPDGTIVGGELITRTHDDVLPRDVKADAFADLNATVMGRGVMSAMVAHQARKAMEMSEYPYLSINVSARVLGVETEVALAGSDPSRIKLELTEDAMLDVPGLAACHRLTAKGYCWLLDDLGSGYHDMRAFPTYMQWLLRNVAFDGIKLDCALVIQKDRSAYKPIIAQLGEIRPFVASHIPLIMEGVPRVLDKPWRDWLETIAMIWDGPVLYQLPSV